MGPIGCQRATACLAFACATAAAVLLWGVGAECVHGREYLQGGLLLANAAIATLLESLTALQYVQWRRARRQRAKLGEAPTPLRRALATLDDYKRAVVYVGLAVPCFVHVRRLWLPLLPGAMLLLSATLYTAKYCCELRRQRALVKVPTFVRFKDESVSAEVHEAAVSAAAASGAAASAAAATESAAEPRLSHQSSFASSHSGRSVQMGSKDSGIEAASQRGDGPVPTVAAAPAEAKGQRKAKGLVRACSSSPDRCCLINEDSLSLRE